MVQAIAKPTTFDEFLEWYPENGRRYELISGQVVEMRPIGDHEEISGLLTRKEYWIADYRALGGKRHISSPKHPTFSVYAMQNGVYQLQQLRDDDLITSPLFSTLNMTVNEIFNLLY